MYSSSSTVSLAPPYSQSESSSPSSSLPASSSLSKKLLVCGGIAVSIGTVYWLYRHLRKSGAKKRKRKSKRRKKTRKSKRNKDKPQGSSESPKLSRGQKKQSDSQDQNEFDYDFDYTYDCPTPIHPQSSKKPASRAPSSPPISSKQLHEQLASHSGSKTGSATKPSSVDTDLYRKLKLAMVSLHRTANISDTTLSKLRVEITQICQPLLAFDALEEANAPFALKAHTRILSADFLICFHAFNRLRSTETKFVNNQDREIRIAFSKATELYRTDLPTIWALLELSATEQYRGESRDRLRLDTALMLKDYDKVVSIYNSLLSQKMASSASASSSCPASSSWKMVHVLFKAAAIVGDLSMFRIFANEMEALYQKNIQSKDPSDMNSDDDQASALSVYQSTAATFPQYFPDYASLLSHVDLYIERQKTAQNSEAKADALSSSSSSTTTTTSSGFSLSSIPKEQSKKELQWKSYQVVQLEYSCEGSEQIMSASSIPQPRFEREGSIVYGHAPAILGAPSDSLSSASSSDLSSSESSFHSSSSSSLTGFMTSCSLDMHSVNQAWSLMRFDNDGSKGTLSFRGTLIISSSSATIKYDIHSFRLEEL